MISPINATIATKIQTALANSNVAVVPIAETPLYHLLETCVPIFNVATDSEDPAHVLNESIGMEDNFGIDYHEESLEETVSLVANSVYETMEMLRVSAIPLINAAVATAVDSANAVESNNYSIDSLFLAEIHDNPLVEDLMAQWDGAHVEEVAVMQGFPALDNIEVANLLDFGNPQLNAQLADMVGQHADGWLVDVYDLYFGQTATRSFSAQVNYNRMDEFLVAYVLTQHFEANPPADYEGSLNEYECAIKLLRA